MRNKLNVYNRNQIVYHDRAITKIEITPAIRAKTVDRASKQKEKTYSGRGDAADLVGCLGEVIAERWMDSRDIKYELNLESTERDYKLINSGQYLDVKTKDRSVPPKKGYDCSVPLYNHTHQQPDFFLFVSLQTFSEYWKSYKTGVEKYQFAYVVGSISYEELSKIGIPYLTGEQDWTNGTVMWTGVLNVQMYQLINNQLTIELFKDNGEGDINVPDVEINSELISDMNKKFDNQIIPRPLPPWNQERLLSLEALDKLYQNQKKFHKLDENLVRFRLKNLTEDLQKKQATTNKTVKVNLEEFRLKFNREYNSDLHKYAIEDLLKRYKLFTKEQCAEVLKNIDSTKSDVEMVNNLLKEGYTQKHWLRLRKK